MGRSCPRSGDRVDLRESQDPSGGVLPGVTVTVTGPALQAAAGGVSPRERHLPVPERADRHVHGAFELASFKKAQVRTS